MISGLNRTRETISSVLEKLTSREKTTTVRKFGTFGGVITPDVLTILGVIMFLRLGWVVGNAGFWGAFLIIVLAKVVTICTGLSMSSITTNIRIGAGGAYSIISKSLGLEAGGSIGIPFYIAQTLSTALYIIGFTEGWLRIFPGAPVFWITSITWLGLLIITCINASFAIKIQFSIMAVMGLALLSFFLTPEHSTQFVGEGSFEDAGFWAVFAVFFPAVTGIMAGANMSGDLKDPRKAIPFGTMFSILVTMVIYIAIAYVLAKIATPEELRQNQMIMVDKAFWGPVVILGILGATLSSALGSLLGAPRVLQALAEQRTVPKSRFFAKKTKENEPRNAIVFTGILVFLSLLAGDLNFLASLITMFFLITYGTLNLVVFVQQSLKLISFRPTFKIPRFVPLVGALGCIFIMFLINAIFSLVAIITIVFLYLWLERRELETTKWGDIRGGVFLALAERASRIALKFPRNRISWKPDLLLPIDDPKSWAGPLLFIRSVTYPSGSLFAFTVRPDEVENTETDLNDLLAPIKSEDILVNSAVIEDEDFIHGTKLVIQTLKGGAFRPNILFLTLGSNKKKDGLIETLVEHSQKYQMGCVILRQHQRGAFGMQNTVNLWLRDKSPNWQLAMLIALQLQNNWDGIINLITATEDPNDEKRLYQFLNRLSDEARMPSMTEFHVLVGKFDDNLRTAPRADINIFGLRDKVSFDFMRYAGEQTKSSCLFVKDSGFESALV